MSNIFDEKNVNRDTAGRFDEKPQSEAEARLTPASALMDTLVSARKQAAELHAAATSAFNRVNKAIAVAALQEQFPGATMAIFGRNGDVDNYTLCALRGERDIDFEDADVKTTFEQQQAINAAENAIDSMGDDDNVLEQLDWGSEHDDWYEFQLDLTETPEATRPTETFLDTMDYRARSRMDAALSERDGRLASVVDTDEIAYRLEEDGYIDDDELNSALISKFGSIEAAAKAIADSNNWYGFREDMADMVAERLSDGIERAARAVL